MPHAIQIRQTGAPEVLDWTAVDVGEPGSGQAKTARLMVTFGQASGPIDPIVPIPLPIHGATRCARRFRERAVRRSGFGKGAH